MNRNEIGVNAGKVWQLLSNNEKWSYGLLKRKSGLKDKELGCQERTRLSSISVMKNSMYISV